MKCSLLKRMIQKNTSINLANTMNETIDLENLHYLKTVEDAARCSRLQRPATSLHVFANFPLLRKRLACKPRSSFRTTFLANKTGIAGCFQQTKAVAKESSFTPSLALWKRCKHTMNNGFLQHALISNSNQNLVKIRARQLSFKLSKSAF